MGRVKHSKLQLERQREYTIVSVLVSNHLHDLRLLDPNALADSVGPMTTDAVLDGDIPARIDVRKPSYGPVSIKWKLWPDEPGIPTFGSMTISRVRTTSAELNVFAYDRARKRSPRLAQIDVPDAKWGLSSVELAELGIATTY